MKNCKKILSIVLVIIMLTSVLTGCGSKSNKPTVDTLVGFAQKTIEDSESVDLVLNMILDMEIEEDEYREDMNTNIDDVEIPARQVNEEEENDYDEDYEDDSDDFDDDLDSIDDEDFNEELESEFENELLKGDEA